MKKSLLPGGGSKTILLSKRANIFYLDKVKVHVRNERVVYQIVRDDGLLDYNLPDCNTALVLLGKGSSITDAAIRALAKSGVVVGFAGTGGSPVHALVDFVFLNPADEYRPTEYCQSWVAMWQDSVRKIEAAKKLQVQRIKHVMSQFSRYPRLQDEKIDIPREAADRFRQSVEKARNEQDLLLAEAGWTKLLYKSLAQGMNVNDFVREPGVGSNIVNGFLDQGNYLMYGLATVALHALGIPPAFALVHGKTRRGALVFDIADICKDAYVMPRAFHWGTCKYPGNRDQAFRTELIAACQKEEVLDTMIDTIKSLVDR